MSELLPCPFCGSTNLQTYTNTVSCKECDSYGPDLGHSSGEADRQLSMEQWNRRDAPQQSEPVREACANERANKLLERMLRMLEQSGYALIEHNDQHNNPVKAWMAEARAALPLDAIQTEGKKI